MKKQIKSLVLRTLLCLSILGYANVTIAQTYDEPIITFKTNIFKSYGEANQFSLVIGSIDSTQYVDVDCGFGKIEYEVQPAYMDSLNQMGGTLINCQVSSDGIVKIYGNPNQIDYFNASGCYISSIEFNGCDKLIILDLTHNELEGLDLSNMPNLQAVYVSDNTFSAESPLKIGKNKPNLTILEMNTIEHLDPEFNLSDYPNLMSFDGYHNMGLKKCDPTGCPNLMRLTLDVTDVESVDVSKNLYLRVLNISNTKITSIDLSKNPYLTELYCDHVGSYNYDYKLTSLDITHNPKLKYLFCGGNKFTNIDISKCPELITISASNNYLTSFDVSNNPNLYIVEVQNNCLDFVSLPLDPGTWNTYYYGQRNFPVEKSYKVGSTFDYSSRVIREETTTDVVLYSVSESSPESPSLVDPSYYTYENGVMTINKIPEDSVYIAFANSAFPDAILRTNKFKIKSEEEYGDSIKAFSFTSGLALETTMSFGIGIEGATPENPIEFYVSFGDSKPTVFSATSSTAPVTANVVGKKNGYSSIDVFVKEGTTLSAIDVKDIPMYSADVTKSASLRTLNIVNAGLYSIDLSWNRCLTSLNLNGNNLSSLSLAGNNGYYEKNALTDINLSNNKLTDLTLNNVQAIKKLNLSNNQLTKIDLSDADYILNVDLSNNMFETLDFTYCSIMTRLDVSHNNLSSIVMPTECGLQYFACNNNNFTIETLPPHGNLSDENYVYAPQRDLYIPTKGPGIDLSKQNRVINGTGTVYTWKDSKGNTLIEGTDYINNNGNMRFLNTSVGEIVCEMTNAAYPGFTGDKVFKTTPILAAGMPTNEIASFTTVKDGDAVTLSLAAAQPNTAIYIGWDGNENLSQYLLGTTYQLFDAQTKAGVNVKVYTYEPSDKVSVFSMSGATLSKCDMSKLTDAINVSVSNAGLSEIALPQSANFKETTLDGNNLSAFDASKYPNLTTLSLNDNVLTTLDVTNNPELQVLSVANNQLSEIKLNNNNIWALYLDHNNFTEINLDGVPNVSQFTITNNQLTSINVDNLSQLLMLGLTGNNLTFKTLPKVNPRYISYSYSNQAPIDVAPSAEGVIDLADQAVVDATQTVYRWFLGAPIINDYGELEGEELILGTEYTLENGVTTFLKDFEGVMCVMTNAKFPDLFLYTSLMDVTAGIECVINDDAKSMIIVNDNNITIKSNSVNDITANLVSINGAIIDSTTISNGIATFKNVTNGIYIITIGSETHKVMIK